MTPAAGTVHLYRASLTSPPVPVGELAALLADDERDRVERFHFEHLRRRHEVATGLLRLVLGQVTGAEPHSLRFATGDFGKPSLSGGPSFNHSHSGDWWLLGVAAAGRLGVDVEVHRTLSDLDAVARSTFHSEEAAEVTGHRDPKARHRAFFRVWSRKEAFIKAVGMGLSYPLDRFRVASDDRADQALQTLDDAAESIADWTLRSVSWAPDLSAAIAWDRRDVRIRWCPVEDRAP